MLTNYLHVIQKAYQKSLVIGAFHTFHHIELQSPVIVQIQHVVQSGHRQHIGVEGEHGVNGRTEDRMASRERCMNSTTAKEKLFCLAQAERGIHDS